MSVFFQFSFELSLSFSTQRKYKQKSEGAKVGDWALGGGKHKSKKHSTGYWCWFCKDGDVEMPMLMKMRIRMRMSLGMPCVWAWLASTCSPAGFFAALLCRPAGRRTTNYRMLLKADFKAPSLFPFPFPDPAPAHSIQKAKAKPGKQRLQMGQVCGAVETTKTTQLQWALLVANANTGFSFTFCRFKIFKRIPPPPGPALAPSAATAAKEARRTIKKK